MKQMISEFFIYYSIYYLYIWIVLDSFLEIDLHRVDRPLRILFRKFFDSFDISMFLLSTSLLCYAHTIQIIDINSLIYDYRLIDISTFYFLLPTFYPGCLCFHGLRYYISDSDDSEFRRSKNCNIVVL